MEIVIDTNILIYATERRIDLFEAIKERFGSVPVKIPNLVLREVMDLSEKARKGSDKRAAKLALEILKTKKFDVVKIQAEYADDAIIQYSKNKDVVVLTMDLRLQGRLERENIKYTYLNNKKKLN